MNTRAGQHAGSSQYGFTLVELLVVMVIGLILLLGVVTLLRQLHHQFRAQTGVARLNDDARFAFETMRDAIQGAGGVDPTNQQAIEPINTDPTNDANGQLSQNILVVNYWSNVGCQGGATGGVLTVTYSFQGQALVRQCSGPDGGMEPIVGYTSFDANDNPELDVAQNGGASTVTMSADYATLVNDPKANWNIPSQFIYAIDENGDQSIDCWWPSDPTSSQGNQQTCPPSGKNPPDPADVIGVRMILNLSTKNPIPQQQNKDEQKHDYVKRQYVMTFPIDSKLGFFVPNQ